MNIENVSGYRVQYRHGKLQSVKYDVAVVASINGQRMQISIGTITLRAKGSPVIKLLRGIETFTKDGIVCTTVGDVTYQLFDTAGGLFPQEHFVINNTFVTRPCTSHIIVGPNPYQVYEDTYMEHYYSVVTDIENTRSFDVFYDDGGTSIVFD